MTFHFSFDSVSIQRLGDVVEEPEPIDDILFIDRLGISVYKWDSTEHLAGHNPSYKYKTDTFTKPRSWHVPTQIRIQ